MGSKVSDAATLRGRLHDVPNRLGRDSIAPDLPQPIDSPEDRAILDGRRRGPLIDGAFRPHWDRNGTDVLSFANQVSDYPNAPREPGNLPSRVQPVQPVAGRIR